MVEDKQNITADILAREIESWKGFEYALREENRILFNKMLTECQENEDYVRAVRFKGEPFAAESLFMVLILQQQKMIKQLITRLSESRPKPVYENILSKRSVFTTNKSKCRDLF